MIPNPAFCFMAGMMIGGALRKGARHNERFTMVMIGMLMLAIAFILHF